MDDRYDDDDDEDDDTMIDKDLPLNIQLYIEPA